VHVSRAHFGAFCAQNSLLSHEIPPLQSQVLHRVMHTIHKPPVDITVDKEASLNGEKAQQNQHFK
jgi:hypothetical protein